MKRGLSFLLLLLVLLLPTVKMATVVSFQMQQASIAALLCEFRNQAENGCQGHCYLRRQLEKQSEQNQKLVENLKFNFVEYCDFEKVELLLPPSSFPTRKVLEKVKTPYHFVSITNELGQIFRPPIA